MWSAPYFLYSISSKVLTASGASKRCQNNKENLIPVKCAVFDEAQGIAKTKGEKRMAESIRFGFESYELGTDEAWKRRNSREQFQ